jgi:hypothetical protein
LNGNWALRVDASVNWNGTLKFQGGSGTVVLWSRIVRTESATEQKDVAVPCGMTFPDFQDRNQKYGIYFPDSLFTNTLPSSTSGFSLSTNAAGGTFQSLGPSATFLGMNPLNPPSASWPSRNALSSVDQDGDHSPGVTALTKTGNGYALLPLLGYDKIFLSLRHLATFNGTLDTCDALHGSATVSAIDWYAVGCHTNGGNCDSLESGLFDDQWIRYKPGSATFKMQRLPSTATCTDVKSALP